MQQEQIPSLRNNKIQSFSQILNKMIVVYIPELRKATY